MFASPVRAIQRAHATTSPVRRGLAQAGVLGVAMLGAVTMPAVAGAADESLRVSVTETRASALSTTIERNLTTIADANMHGGSTAYNTAQGMRFEYAAGSFYCRLRHNITTATGGYLNDGEEGWIRLSGVKFDTTMPSFVRHLVADGYTPENDAAGKIGPILGLFYLNGRLVMKFTDYNNTNYWTEQVAFQPDLSKPYDVVLRVIQSPTDGQALTEAYLSQGGGEFRLLARSTKRNRTSDRLRRWSHPLTYANGPVKLSMQRIQTSGSSLLPAATPAPAPAPTQAVPTPAPTPVAAPAPRPRRPSRRPRRPGPDPRARPGPVPAPVPARPAPVTAAPAGRLPRRRPRRRPGAERRPQGADHAAPDRLLRRIGPGHPRHRDGRQARGEGRVPDRRQARQDAHQHPVGHHALQPGSRPAHGHGHGLRRPGPEVQRDGHRHPQVAPI
jgi:hypothetical protein